MTNKNLYTIRYVSQRTGLTPHVIRAWEKRYDAVVPKRSPKNRRLYSEEDVQRLLLLKSMTDAGHNISQVAQLTEGELSDFAQRELATPPSMRKRSGKPSNSASSGDYYKECLEAVLNLDPGALRDASTEAFSGHLGKEKKERNIS